ncbi:MAG: DUF1876 family protein [Candidatus Nanoarchaeia archaeon]|jgi:hypothetical protein|nr:DUF1876 family protein [Candidatus Nanoarchaeia archaeon]
MYSVYSLRKNGYRVWVQHIRPVITIQDDNNNFRDEVLSRGGETKVEVRVRDTDALIGVGTARCSLKDNYNKKLGVQIALGRALCGKLS